MLANKKTLLAGCRTLSPADLKAMTAIHMHAFPSSFLTALGAGAVSRYYQWQLEGPHDAACVGIDVNKQLAGFCLAGTFRGATSGFIRAYRGYLGLQIALRPWVLANAEFRDKLRHGWSSLARARRRPAAVNAPRTASFGVLAIAVEPLHQGADLGKRMMFECEAIARANGFARLHLTVHPENKQAVGFYERLGWTRVPADETWAGYMTKDLTTVGTVI